MPTQFFDPNADQCPSCGVTWEYEVDGCRYSRVVGVVDISIDRTVAYLCPDCDDQWPVETIERWGDGSRVDN